MGVRSGLVQDGLEQLEGLGAPPTLHPRLKRSPADNTEATRKKAHQPIQQHLGRGVRTTLQPPQRVGPYASETVLAGMTVAGFSDPDAWGAAPVPLPPSRNAGAATVRAFALKDSPCPGYDVAVRVEWASLMVCNSATASSSVGYRPRSSFTSAPTESISSHRSLAVAAGPYCLTTLDPSRVFTTSLKEGGKWFI